jgi:transposase
LVHLDEYRSVYAAAQAIGPKVGVGPETLRKWVLQAQVDAQLSPGVTIGEQQRIKALERENRDLKEAQQDSEGGLDSPREGSRPSAKA